MTRVVVWLAAVIAAAATPAPAAAATLVETRIGNETVRLVADQALGRVLIAGTGGGQLVDLASATVYLWTRQGGTQMVHAAGLARKAVAVPPFALEEVGPGPRILGRATTRFRLIVAGKLCSVIDANLGLAATLQPAIEAMTLLDRVNAALKGESRAPCEKVPYGRYSRIGWPLQIQDDNAPPIATAVIDTDYTPNPGELEPPAEAADITPLLNEM